MLAFDTAVASGPDLVEAAHAAPHYTSRYSHALRRAIQTVHGLPRLFRGTELGEIEVYVGRSFPEGLRNRFRDHHTKRRHEHGVVCFTCPTTDVRRVERLAIRLVDRLRRRTRLCVANVDLEPSGPLPASPVSAIYLTWRLVPRRPVGRPTPTEVRQLADALYADPALDFPRSTLEAGLRDLTRPKTGYLNLSWHPEAA
ncbi:MAG: hypothetical protein CMN29_07735 [Sandaracinus sp.]|nr:hypothetical protein [Sandaracinus sp.]